MNKNLRVVTIVTLLIIMILPVTAVNYPTYKPTRTAYSTTPSVPSDDNSGNTTYGGYSTTTSGGVTTYGEGSAIGARGPRRMPIGGYTENPDGSPVENGSENETYIDSKGNTWVYYSDGGWEKVSSEDAGNPMPIGSPLLMLLFAAMAAAVVAWRRKNLVTE